MRIGKSQSKRKLICLLGIVVLVASLGFTTLMFLPDKTFKAGGSPQVVDEDGLFELPEWTKYFQKGETVHVAKVVELSHIPNAKVSEYPSCLVTGLIELEQKEPESRHQRIIANFVGFENRKLTKLNRMYKGLRIAVSLIEPEDIAERYRNMQRSDTLTTVNSFSLSMFYVKDWKALGGGPSRTYDYGSAGFRSVTLEESIPLTNQPVKKEILDQSHEFISLEINRIESLLQGYGGWEDWSNHLEEYRNECFQRIYKAGGAINSKGNWHVNGLHHEEFRKIMVNPEINRPIQLLLDLHKQFSQKGIHLLVIPFPLRNEYYAAHAFPDIFPEDGIVEPFRLYLHYYLLKRGVDVMDLMPALRSRAGEFDTLVFYDCADRHPADAAIRIAAEEVAARLKEYGLNVRSSNLPTKQVKYTIPHQLFTYRFPAGAQYVATTLPSAWNELPSSKDYLLIGDSFLFVPDGLGCKDAAFRAHLANATGHKAYRVGCPAGTNLLSKHLKRESLEVFRGRRVAVLMMDTYWYFLDSKQFEVPAESEFWGKDVIFE